jgi:hypothetical protein
MLALRSLKALAFFQQMPCVLRCHSLSSYFTYVCRYYHAKCSTVSVGQLESRLCEFHTQLVVMRITQEPCALLTCHPHLMAGNIYHGGSRVRLALRAKTSNDEIAAQN